MESSFKGDILKWEVGLLTGLQNWGNMDLLLRSWVVAIYRRCPISPRGRVYSLDWTPEKNRIVSASQDGRLIVWNALTSQETHAIKLPCAWVMTCAFSPSGQSVACGGLDSVCSIFNLSSPLDKDGNIPVSRMVSGHKGYVSSCQYVPDDDTRLITSSDDHTCVLWHITIGLRTSVFGGEFQSGHTADVVSVSINGSNSRMFVSGSCDATARLWDTRVASRVVRTFHGHEGDVNSVKFFSDGNIFRTSSDDGTCRLFDIRTGHQLQVYSHPQKNDNNNNTPIVTFIAFSISGRLLFASYSNGDCFVWDTLLAEESSDGWRMLQLRKNLAAYKEKNAILNAVSQNQVGFAVAKKYR
ncbi:hypothetical protein L2E82_44817 [Cichorium intybus]|uniref:Uncharacterized protein n=1 Tax=Cichorium intybus TaxID=13427 RepID=A0ACB8ZS98_CICIN|nr:hypothetical protein L2E82_44817 [Cichorium intybus]